MTLSINNASHSVLLSRNEAARLLGLKPQTLAKWASTQRYDLPYVKVGKAVRYRRGDIDRFMTLNTLGQIKAG